MTIHPTEACGSGLLPELASVHRPRLRAATPVLWRTATTICLGDRVVVDRVAQADAAWLTGLDGLRTREQVEAELPIDPGQARRLLRAATAAAALEDAACLPDTIRWAQPERRDAEWGRVGAAIEAAGSVPEGLEAIRARSRCAVIVRGDDPLAAHVRQALDWAGLSTPASTRRSVTVVATVGHPDVPLGPGAEPDGTYLAVRVWGGRAVIEPLHTPGGSGCPRCRQLHLRDADPAWPLLAVQWDQAVARMTPRPLDPLVGALAAVHAITVLRRWADGSPADPAAIEVAATRPAARRVPRPHHPLCGCRWATAPSPGGPAHPTGSVTMGPWR